MRSFVCVGFLALLVSSNSALAQNEDYRQFFIPPKTVPDFWRAISFEVDLGRYDLAAEHLKNMLALPPTDEDLLALEKKEGLSSFIKLRTIQKWSDNPKLNAEAKKAAEDFIDKITSTLKKHLSDPERLAKYTKNLAASPEERRFAIAELRRSGALVVPFVLAELQKRLGAQESKEYTAIVTALPSLGRDTVPPLLASLDVNDPIIQEHIIDAIRHRDDLALLPNRAETDPRPWLWHFAASPKHPERLRKVARDTLAQLQEVVNADRFADPKADPTRGINPDKLPLARTELTLAAERYYNHKVRFPDDKAITIWKWTDKGLISEAVSPSKAEEHFGLRFARQALDLDPSYQRAQTVFVKLAVDKAMEGNLDKSLGQAAPAVKDLLARVNPDLLAAALDQAISERRLGAALGLTRALGDSGDVRAARPKNQGQPVLVRALAFPDRRVQFAAADALLRIGASPPPQASGRIVEVLRRAVMFDPLPRALVADPNRQRGEEVGNALKEAGFTSVVVKTGKEAISRLQESGDIDIILLDYQIYDPQINDLLTQLRADVDWGAIPLIITVPPNPDGFRPPEAIVRLERLANTYRNVWVMNGTLDPDILKKELPQRIIEAAGQPLTDAERKNMTGEAMVWLKRLATGEVPGYDVRPAETTILRGLRVEEFGTLAMEAAARIPTRSAQRELAQVVLDGNVRPEFRAAAAVELSRHIQQNGRVLLKPQVEALEKLHQTTDDMKLRTNVALVLGSLRPDAARTGNQLKLFVPAAGEPAPAPAPKEKEKEKEKEKDN